MYWVCSEMNISQEICDLNIKKSNEGVTEMRISWLYNGTERTVFRMFSADKINKPMGNCEIKDKVIKSNV